VLGGSTTLLKPNFQSFSDNFLMRVNSNGDTLWTKIFYGVNDQFENVSSLILDQDENIIAGVATASYVSPGFVPNKHAVMKFSPQGQLLKATLYNNGSSHYPRISKCSDRGILLSGFTNAYSGPVGFRTLLMKMDSTLSTGCIETDVTNQTLVQSKLFRVNMPVPITGSSGTVVNVGEIVCLFQRIFLPVGMVNIRGRNKVPTPTFLSFDTNAAMKTGC
jgi:hypothetical protein